MNHICSVAACLQLLVCVFALSPVRLFVLAAEDIDDHADASSGEIEAASNPPAWLPAVSVRLLELLDIRLENGSYELPRLMYSYEALEPYMSERTVRVHHTGHHAAYTKKMNSILSRMPSADAVVASNPLQQLMNLDALPEDVRDAFRNQAGGFVNHAFTFFVMGPLDQSVEVADQGPSGKILDLITESFGSTDAMKEQFSGAAAKLFGSGYVWLCLENVAGVRRLTITENANQDSPLSGGFRPVLGIDLWEHAYYLQYQNKRVDYIATWWQLVSWERVGLLLDAWIETEPADSTASSVEEQVGTTPPDDTPETRDEL
ncbi:superoxide dismutase [Mn]-like [Sycon ciliatum]|uniref:superoxide dismutase [Mn]-like n=1 Tax=Sycon ciliatum TaxID=27933 RepID=UPI0031F6C177